jgi:hypothetical protein
MPGEQFLVRGGSIVRDKQFGFSKKSSRDSAR